MNELIYDRTQTDVTNKTPKGYYNTSDLNRVEEWCRYLADELNSVGYNINITTKTNWTSSDLRTASEMMRIRNNLKAIVNGFHGLTPVNSAVTNWDYNKANNWEKVINEIYHLLWGMEDWYVYSGVANAGQNRLWQHRFRQEFERPLAYIKSNGTQFIDTGIKPNTNTKIVVKFRHEGTVIDYERLFGAWTSGGATVIDFCRNVVNARFGLRIGSNNFVGNVIDIATGTDYVLEATNSALKLNGETKTTWTPKTYTSSTNLCIFRSHDRYGNFRIYYFKIYDNENLVRDFIPALDSNKVPCLYDKVSQGYFYNQGTGTFEYEYIN